MKNEFEIYEIDKISNTLLENFTEKIMCFYGEMGAGKTTLITHILKILGVEDLVSSPTYSLVNQYHSPHGIIYHLDLFRIKNQQELLDLGIEEILFSGQYIMIEWPELAEQLIPEDYLKINLTKQGLEKRTITVEICEIE